MRKIGLLLIFCIPFLLLAEDISITLISRTELMGKQTKSKSLYNQTSKILKTHNVEIIDIQEAEASNISALIKQIKKGKIDERYASTTTDAIMTIELLCNQSSTSLLGTRMKSYPCDIDISIVRKGTKLTITVIYARILLPSNCRGMI